MSKDVRNTRENTDTGEFVREKTLSFHSLDLHEYDLALEKICNLKNVTYLPLGHPSFTIIFQRTESTRYLRVTL